MRLATLLLTLLTACATTVQPIPTTWLSTPAAKRIRTLESPMGSRPAGAIHVDGNRLMNGDKPLTPAFSAIDSFDVSPEGKEVVFSAKPLGGGSFDVGLVSVDGSDVHWVPQDPADEVSVQWAPRGNKVSFFVRGRSGDFVRTVHVPTSVQLTVDFPYARLRALAWEPAAERYSVAYDSPDASDRVETLRYGGEERRITVPPEVKLDIEIEPVGDALVLRPPELRYNEKLPLVVWPSADRLAWNDARGALEGKVRAALAIVTKPPDKAFWDAIHALPWIDETRVFVLGDTIRPDPTLPPGTWRRQNGVVSVSPDRVESFAAGFIADQWKGTLASNGRR